MRILDEHDNELNIEDLDMETGELYSEQILKEHHEATEAIQPVQHFRVNNFYFTDGTSMHIEEEDDPHVNAIDIQEGKFGYNVLEGEEPKTVRGIDLSYVVDKPGQEAREAWDEYEDIQRWRSYTEEEIAAMKEQREREAAQANFLANGEDLIKNLQSTIEALNAQIASFQEAFQETTQVESENATLALAEMVNQ